MRGFNEENTIAQIVIDMLSGQASRSMVAEEQTLYRNEIKDIKLIEHRIRGRSAHPRALTRPR